MTGVFICNFCLLLVLPPPFVYAGTIFKEQNEIIPRDDQIKTPYSLEEIFDNAISPYGWNGTWLTDNTFLYSNVDGDYHKFDVSTKSSSLFLNGSFLHDYPGASITLSPDQTYVLIRYNVSYVFRHSTTAIYTVYDIANQKYYDVNNKMAAQLALFDKTGHGIAYVYKNNIYYLPDIVDDSNLVQVTRDGVEGIVYNGLPDWVYEEEVLGKGVALWFSPDSKNLVYAKFNDTNVEDFSYFLYGTPGSLDDQYPTIRTIKYPKAGTPNPVVQPYIYNFETKSTSILNLPECIENSEENNDYILYDVTWISNSEIAMISTNRVQNEAAIVRCGLNGSCYQETGFKQQNGWLNPKIPKYSEDGTNFLDIIPQPHGDDYFYHLILKGTDTDVINRLTNGNRVVTDIYGWDQKNNLVYYASTLNGTPTQQHVFVVNTETLEDKCLTCDFLVDDEPCKYASASFNPEFTYFAKICQGPNPTYVVIQSLTNYSDTYLWIDNADAREKLLKKLSPLVEDVVVPLSSGFTARARLLLPPCLDESRTYPAVVNVYAGPDSNLISDAYSGGIKNYWVTNRTYIYIYIDGRGSGKDGLKKLFQIYRKMGTIEIEDQIEVTKYLQYKYPFIDRERTGIWGWSYGGFASTWALVKDTQNVFKFALAVAPVTSFIYYDTIYTERYMGLPTEDDNLLGYNNTDVTRNVEALRGKLYFIIHGNADDNVHHQQSMVLVKALELADIAFRQQSYPDENHSLGHVSRHLYHTIDRFWARAFGLEGPPLAT